MLSKQLLAMEFEEQRDYVLSATKDATDDDPFCFVINLDEGRLQDMLDNPGDYEIGFDIQQRSPTMSDKRAQAINEGAPLSTAELKLLKAALIEIQSEDGFEGINYMSRNIALDDTNLLSVFNGQAYGHGVACSFYGLYSSQADCMAELRKDLEPDQSLNLI